MLVVLVVAVVALIGLWAAIVRKSD